MPPRYHFEPIDEELIHCYLEKKAKGQPLQQNVSIAERDLYGENANPWNVLSDNDPWDNYSTTWDKDRMKNTVKKNLHVLTKLSKISKKRTEIRAGCGTWDGQTSTKSIKNSNEHTSKDDVICKITKILKLPKTDHPVVGFIDQIGCEIIEELGKKRSITMEDCPHGNKKQKCQFSWRDFDDYDWEKVFDNSLDLVLNIIRHY
ncbi:NAC transcription factor 25-like [Forsythia ovata]|uniref:NAC transcription factor 25-like n=1 Tax=Forsythia ovata TaxID=205694 RepID=A0ABD1TBQ2_9LAMI